MFNCNNKKIKKFCRKINEERVKRNKNNKSYINNQIFYSESSETVQSNIKTLEDHSSEKYEDIPFTTSIDSNTPLNK